ncbi:MAG: carboxymuconolactone decarboxylase family protein, partial [Aestuariivirga sp.]
MSTLAPPADPESDPRVKAVFDDIRATRKSDVVNNFW